MNNLTETDPFDSLNVYKNRELIYKKIPKEYFQQNFKINKNFLSIPKIEIEYKIREVKINKNNY